MRVRLRTDRLAELIARSGVSQNHWALRLGLSRGHWSDIVNGRHPYPSARTRQLMLDGFAVPFDALFAVEAGPTAGETGFRAALADRYLIDREIGQGGMGTVYLARDLRLSRSVAIKAISAEAVSGIGVDRFLQELSHASRLQHPNIAPIYDAGVVAGQPYFVMPWVRDGSLADLLAQRRRLAPAEAVAIIRDIAAGLAQAHAHAVLHCDIKPGNILLAGRHAYLADFGIARAIHFEVEDWRRRDELDISAGTPAYVSPEQAAGEADLDGRSDLYSLACVAYEMLGGQPPFRGTTTRDIVASRFVTAPPDLLKLAPELPRPLAAVVSRGLALNRDERPATVSAFAEDLAAAARGGVPALLGSARRGLARAGVQARQRAGSVPGASWLARRLSGAGQDLRFSLRGLVRRPAFALTAVLTLALAIGANTSIFSVLRFLVLDRLPVAAADDIRLLFWSGPDERGVSNMNSTGRQDPLTGLNLRSNVSYPMFVALDSTAGAAGTLLAGYTYVRELAVTVGSQPPTTAGAMLVTGDYFGTLGLPVAEGRPILPSDDAAGARPVAVLGHRFWQRAFAGDRGAIGATVRVNGTTFEVVGVTAAAYHGLSRGGFFPLAEITLPLSAQPLVAREWSREGASMFASNVRWLRLVARIPAASLGAVLGPMNATLGSMITPSDSSPVTPQFHPLNGGRGEMPGSSDGQRQLLLLGVITVLVLLIACVNLATLMLARSVARERELAVRRALGASRFQLARQVMMECLLIAGAGGAFGLLLTFAARGVLPSLLAVGMSSWGNRPIELPSLRLDITMGLATMVAVAIATVVAGLLPALRQSAADPASQLGNQAAGTSSRRLSARSALLAFQIALSLPLLLNATLLLRTLDNIGEMPLGFDPRGVALFQLNPAYSGLPRTEHALLYQRVVEALERVPGVQSASLVENALLSGITSSTQASRGATSVPLYTNAVGPRFFETMGMRIIEGRAPDWRDIAGAPRVGVLNAAGARLIFGGAPAVGQVIRLEGRPEGVLIIGLAEDSRYDRLRAEVRPTLFDAALQRSGYGGHHVIVKSAQSLSALEPLIRRAVADVHPGLPVPDLRSQEEQIARSVARERVATRLLTLLSVFAMLLSSIGVNGVAAYSVARRTNEFGVRKALGARPGAVLWQALRPVLLVALIGIAGGIPLAAIGTRLVRSLLFGVEAGDPAMLVLAGSVMLAVAGFAALLPAFRAARIDPMTALRVEQ